MSTPPGPAYRDPLCRFYTRAGIGELLVGLMSQEAPARILDLASGAGALSQAAGLRWDAAEITSVDIDAAALPGGTSARGRHRHIVADGLDVDLPAILAADRSGFDATLCNPPYRIPEWRPGFARILEEAGLDGAFATRRETSAEALFVAQNLRLTRAAGQIGLIVPDGLVTGRRSAPFRRALLEHHRIECVVQLPRRAFRRTDALAFILVIGKDLPANTAIPLKRLERDGTLLPPILVEPIRAEERLDYDFHAHAPRGGPTVSLRDLGAEVVRGTLQSNEARGASFPVFHTTHFPKGDARRAHSLPDDEIPNGIGPLVVAEPADILVARVDRELHAKVCGVSAGRAALSATVFRVRLEHRWRDKVLGALLSPLGEARLRATARGVGPRMLGKEDLLTMPLPL